MKAELPRVELWPEAGCSLACAHCTAGSDRRPRSPAAAADYAPHLARFRELATWPYTVIAGGEPFLHPDLPGFLDACAAGPYHAITNGFWLLRKDWRDVAAAVLPRLAALVVSRYPVYVDRLGVAEWDRRLDALGAEHDLPITTFHPHDPATLRFTRHEFHERPLPVVAACAMRFCYQLLPDGRLAKCPLGRWIGDIPHATAAFRESYRAHSYFDLATGTAEGLAAWAAPEAHPACRLCGLATGHATAEPWATAPRGR